MSSLIAVAPATGAFHVGLVLTTFGFGFRHGIDWDHLAALTDITGSQEDRRRSMLFASLYAAGHALVVFALGFSAIVLAAQLPKAVDAVMARVVGATLIGLGVYVFSALLRQGRDFRMRSRWMLVFSGVRRGVRWARARASPEIVEVIHDHDHAVVEAHEHDGVATVAGRAGANRSGRAGAGDVGGPGGHHRHGHRHLVAMPDDPFLDYGRATAFGVGMIHGIGAETPTQILIFLTAAGAGGPVTGIVLLGCFLVGLLTANTVVALAGTFGFLGATRNFGLYVAVSVLTATFSLVVGSLFLFGRSTLLPAIFGG